MKENSHPKERPFVAFPIYKRISDTDMFRHINNVSYLAYIEGVRLEFFESHGCDIKKELAITRSVHLDYCRSATFFDPLVALVRVSRIGLSSVDLEIHIANANDHSIVYVMSKVSQIHCCAKTGQKCPVSDEVRETLRSIGQID